MLQMGRMEEKDELICLDLESSGYGNLGRFCGGKQNSELKKTTRDEPDDKLMRWRLSILKEHGARTRRNTGDDCLYRPSSGCKGVSG